MLVAEITKGAPLPGTPAALMLEDLQAAKDEQAAQDAAAAVEAGDMPDPNEEPPIDETMPPDTQGEAAASDVGSAEASPAPEEAMPLKAIDDLDRWERKALKRLKATGKALVGFESDAIDPDDHARITAALTHATTQSEVKAAFKQDATDKLLDSVDADARAWAEEATNE